MAFANSIEYKKVSNRGNTKPRWDANQRNYRTEIHRLARRINRNTIKIKKANWERLSGMGRNSNGITKMEYNGLTANAEEGIANVMADHASNTFKPLEDEGYDYNYFQNITD